MKRLQSKQGMHVGGHLSLQAYMFFHLSIVNSGLQTD